MKSIVAGLAVIAGVGLVSPALAQSFPTKPLTIVVPNSPGGATDLLARQLGDQAARILGQPVIVESRGGGGGTTGPAYVKRQPADGYTLLLPGASTLSATVALGQDVKVGYSMAKDFEPIGMLYYSPQVIVVNPSLPVQSLGELIAYAKANPGKLNYSSNGVAGIWHLGIEYLSAMAGGLKMAHIPYKGGGEAATAVVANETQFTMTAYVTAMPHVREGTLRAIAHTGTQPSAMIPGLPAVEQSLPGYEFGAYMALVVRAETPPDRLKILHDAFKAAHESIPVQDYYMRAGVQQTPMDRETYFRLLAADHERFRRAAVTAGLIK